MPSSCVTSDRRSGRQRMRRAFVLLCLFLSCLSSQAESFTTKARTALLLDAETGTVLFAKNADEPFPPASLAKLMTMELVFHALRQGTQTLDAPFKISERAWRKGGAPAGGSTMFAEPNSTIRLGDLIQGAVVQSANDACIAIAEGFAGSEDQFAEMMTARARQIGLKVSVFRNATGLPAEGQVTTAREIVKLAAHIWREYPDFYRLYGQRDFTWNKITQRNRNPLLTMGIGADGFAVGYTEGFGFAIVGSTERGGRRTFLALSGVPSERERVDEAREMLDWATSFRKVNLFPTGEIVGQADVYGGATTQTGLRTQSPVTLLLPQGGKSLPSARIVYEGPLIAPIPKGAPVGTLEVWSGGTLSMRTPLYAASAVAVGSTAGRAYDAAAELLIGWIRNAPS